MRRGVTKFVPGIKVILTIHNKIIELLDTQVYLHTDSREYANCKQKFISNPQLLHWTQKSSLISYRTATNHK